MDTDSTDFLEGFLKKGVTEHLVNAKSHFPKGSEVRLENNNSFDNTQIMADSELPR